MRIRSEIYNFIGLRYIFSHHLAINRFPYRNAHKHAHTKTHTLTETYTQTPGKKQEKCG